MGEIISDEKAGFLCPPGDAQILSQILEKALSLSSAERREILRAARDKVSREFDMPHIVESTVNYYQSLIHR